MDCDDDGRYQSDNRKGGKNPRTEHPAKSKRFPDESSLFISCVSFILFSDILQGSIFPRGFPGFLLCVYFSVFSSSSSTVSFFSSSRLFLLFRPAMRVAPVR